MAHDYVRLLIHELSPVAPTPPEYRGLALGAVLQHRAVTPRAGEYTSHVPRRPGASGAAGIRARVRLHSAAWGLRRPQTPATFARAQHRGCRRNTLAAARPRTRVLPIAPRLTRHHRPSFSQIRAGTGAFGASPALPSPLRGALPLTRHSSLRDLGASRLFAASETHPIRTRHRPPPACLWHVSPRMFKQCAALCRFASFSRFAQGICTVARRGPPVRLRRAADCRSRGQDALTPATAHLRRACGRSH